VAFTITRGRTKDFDNWRTNFDSLNERRRSSGVKNATIYRSAADPNDLLIVLEWDNLNNAQQYFQSQDVKQAMERGGYERVEIAYLENWGGPSGPSMTTQR
jgi:heme-degrading monooxygenase HmoA